MGEEKVRTTILVDKKVVKEAKELGLNISKTSENALKEAIRRLKGSSRQNIRANNPVHNPKSTDSIFKLPDADHNVQARHG